MTTLIDDLHDGKIPHWIEPLAQQEAMDRQDLIRYIQKGYVVVPRNRNRSQLTPMAIGKETRVKVNANIGTSPDRCDFETEMEKVRAAVAAGADTVMDLSISGDVDRFREAITRQIDVPLGTVPIYEAMMGLDSAEDLSIQRFMEVMEKQGREGVDFMTIHAGLLQKHLSWVEKRVLGVVSRGGALLVRWMHGHGQENFLYTHFDEILQLAHEYDITLSLGDGLRPGCTADANDPAQFGELEVIGELVQRCRAAHVQVMVEGPGHVPMHLIEENVKKQKVICDGAPFYVLGPLVIDYAAGYDHIAGAIGGAIAAFYGTDFLCYVTPAEHLRLPTIQDVKEGVIASRIAAAAADLARGRQTEINRNRDISTARGTFDWNRQQTLAVDPEKFCNYLEKVDMQAMETDDTPPCTMCGQWCAIKQSRVEDKEYQTTHCQGT